MEVREHGTSRLRVWVEERRELPVSLSSEDILLKRDLEIWSIVTRSG